ncbi:hypothetical protein BH18THE2_BH18THE2_07700 [soil metagenome]
MDYLFNAVCAHNDVSKTTVDIKAAAKTATSVIGFFHLVS